jgi:hypothetical protein
MDRISYGEARLYQGEPIQHVRVIMVIRHVLVVELLYQVVTGWIPVLECPLSSAHGRLWLCLVMPGIKWRDILKTRL